MPAILVPVDGSDNALRALEHVIKRCASAPATKIHLLNVQIPIVSGVVKMFVNQDQINAYYRDEAGKALAAARARLDQAKIAYQHHIGVGHVAETIVAYAKQHGCDEIIMGTRGMGAVTNLVLGSAATQVIHLADVPVTLIK